MGPLIVLTLRIFVPLAIFRWPLGMGIVVMLLDGTDVILVDAIGYGYFPKVDSFYHQNYHMLDKYLDMYYLFFEFLVSLRWQELLAKWTSVILFIWRTIGFALFELTGMRIILFFAPNLFENFYIFYLAARKIYPEWQIRTKKRLFIVLALLYIPKFGQEYLLHVRQAQPWTWFKGSFLLK